jgi:hypothetical protein
MYFTLAVSAESAAACDTLVSAALATDPALMPVPGPPGVAWRAEDGQTALVTWPASSTPVTGSQSGTILVIPNGRIQSRASLTRVDPVFEATAGDSVVHSDRAQWAAATTGRLDAIDPVFVATMLNVGFPVGEVTPFRGVRALPGTGILAAYHGTVADRLVTAVEPLTKAGSPVELSLTGGKDSRLVAAALAAAGVEFRTRTHGFPDHPDVQVAAKVAARLGVEHVVATPVAPGDRADPLRRLRAAVLVGDGMISAFENIGYPDPSYSDAIAVGGHGGELLRGGYAEVVGTRPGIRRAAASAELLRRMTTRRVRLLRPGPAAAYLASLTPWAASLRHGPLAALDHFYLVNRGGRWSAAARQAYLIRENLVQPLFDEAVVRVAYEVPLPQRVSGQLTRDTLAALRPELADIPFAGKGGGTKTFDWRRDYGQEIAAFFREYILDAGPLFDVISRPAAERLLTVGPPSPDPGTVWSLATLACLVTGDYRNAREPSPVTFPVGAR